MKRDNKLNHFARNLDIREVCEYHNSVETHDKIPIRKILIANLDPTVSKCLYSSSIRQCLLLWNYHCLLFYDIDTA